ncbi:MAG: SusC/RagA family TonB-linked outer membrane protein, partial [Sphingobacteriales bacterium]
LALMLMTTIQLSAGTRAQTVTLNEKSAKLETVLKKIKKQSGYAFLYQDQLLRNSLPVSIDVVNTSIEDALKIIFREQPLSYEIVSARLISIKAKPLSVASKQQPILKQTPEAEITGMVRGENGEPLAGATVTVQGTSTSVVTDEQGRFTINVSDNNASLVFSFVGYQAVTIKASAIGTDPIVLTPQQDVIQDVVVVGYGTQRRAKVTAAISSVPMKEIQDMPVSNVANRLPKLSKTPLSCCHRQS